MPATAADISFLDIRIAEGDSTFAAEEGIHDGVRVELLGLVTKQHELARFYVGCCVADALPVAIPIETSQAYQLDSWLDVRGTLERRGRHFVVVTDSVREVGAPKHPYLSFAPDALVRVHVDDVARP